LPPNALVLVCRIAIMTEYVFVVFGIIAVPGMGNATDTLQRLLASVTHHIVASNHMISTQKTQCYWLLTQER
jgi:hypothetical protein